MTTNITLRMDETLLRDLKHIAVDQNLSVSAWITQVLKKNAWCITEKAFHLGGTSFDRNACYDRIHSFLHVV